MGSMTAVKNIPSGMNQLFFVTAAWRSNCFPLAPPSVATQSRRTPTHHKSFERGSDGAAAAVVALSSNRVAFSGIAAQRLKPRLTPCQGQKMNDSRVSGNELKMMCLFFGVRRCAVADCTPSAPSAVSSRPSVVGSVQLCGCCFSCSRRCSMVWL